VRFCGIPALVLWLSLSLTSVVHGQEPGEAEGCASVEAVVVRAFSHPEESERVRLTDCEGRAMPDVLDVLSRLARPHGVPIEGDPEASRPASSDVAPGIPRLDPGLVPRLAAIARRWPGQRILIVSGVRPHARPTSRHRVGRALDLFVEGVEREQVSEFARGLAQTGVGFYPNSTFTHVDVRARATYWIDLSGPGERPTYVDLDSDTGPHDPETELADADTDAPAERGPDAVGAPGHPGSPEAEPTTQPASAPGAAALADLDRG